jgi:V-type H+-transporting ATPase subunit G
MCTFHGPEDTDRLGIKQHTQGNKEAEEEAGKEAEERIKEIKDAGKKGQDKVVQDLLKAVFEVHPVVPTQASA